MANNNKTFTILMYVVGVLVTFVLLVGTPMLVKAVVENDRGSRTRDDQIKDSMVVLERKIQSDIAHIREQQGEKLEHQGEKLEQIAKMLIRLETKIEILNSRNH